MRRPPLLTALCGFVWLGCLAMVVLGLRAGLKADGYPAWFGSYVMVSAVVIAAIWIPIWQMRRWGIFLVVAGFAVTQSVLVAVGHWTVLSALYGAVQIGIVAKYLPRRASADVVG